MGLASLKQFCFDIKSMRSDWASDTLAQMTFGQKAQGTVMQTGECPGQHVLLEHCQLGKAPSRGRQALPAHCWLSEYGDPMGRHSRTFGQSDDSTSQRPHAVPGNGDEAILAGRAFKGGFPRWLSELHMWPWPMEPAPCLYGWQGSLLTLPFLKVEKLRPGAGH